jgi:hypothetical protein
MFYGHRKVPVKFFGKDHLEGSFQFPAHYVYALFLLFRIRMYVEIQSGADAGMSKQYAYGLVVAFAFNASCGERMTECVEFHPGKTQFIGHFA